MNTNTHGKTDSPMKEIFDRLRAIEIKVYGLFLAGVILWGGVTFFFKREFDRFDAAINQMLMNTSDIRVLDYRAMEQEKFNITITARELDAHKEIEQRFKVMEKEINKLTYNYNNHDDR